MTNPCAFIDIGSGTGGSIDHCARRFGRTPGRGFEIDAEKAAEARRAGFDVAESDVRLVQVEDRSVDFVSAMDFLEHLPDSATAASVLERFARAARAFVFIRHPSFEEMEYLASLGFKLTWSDWNEHPNMMRIEDFVTLFERFGWTEYAIFPRNLIIDSTNDRVVPLSAPRDTMVYDASVHAPKPRVRFDRPIFGQYDIFVRLPGGFTDADWEQFLKSDMAVSAPPWSATIVSAHSITPPATRREFGFYDAETSSWTMRRTAGHERKLVYGAPGRGLAPVIGNFSGRGTGLGVYDPATGYFFLRHALEEGIADVTAGFGSAGSLPVSGDWTRSGIDAIGVYVATTGQWFLRYANSGGPADESFSFGPPNAGWLPIVGDWDGDGRDSVGLYAPETGSWHLRGGSPDGRSDISFTFGPAGGLPVAGDWDGDGRDSIGVYMPDWGIWILRNANTDGPADLTMNYRGLGTPVSFSRQ